MQGAQAYSRLADFFGELATRPLFIVYALRPKADGSGRTDKVPVDPLTLDAIDCHDPARRVTLAEAQLWVASLVPRAPVLAYGVGYVLVEESRTFFFDLDHALTAAGWADYVAPLLAQFPGAFIETSSSGDGIHVLGSYLGPRPLHRTRCAEIRAEFYTAGRFCALTGANGSGAVLTDHTGAVAALITTRFPPRDTEEDDAEWTTGPVPQWSGPTNDDVLLAKAMRSGSAAAIFGGKATFADLWTQNVDKLAAAYPSSTGQPYDGSGADQALANHLAYWTGNDCERIARLLRASGLARDKHDRETYLRNTILRACASQTTWYSGGGATPSPAAEPSIAGVPPTPSTPGAAAAVAPNPYMRVPLPPEDFVSVLSAGAYLYRPTREMWPKKSVETECGAGRPEQIDAMAPVHQLVWAPGQPEYIRERLLIEGGWVDKQSTGAFNMYREPPAVSGNALDVQPWLDHVARIYPETAGHFIRWLAHRAQRPGEKINHALVMGGGSGIGKDTILEPVKLAVGAWNMTEVAPETLFGRFNGFIKSIVLRVSEVRSDEVSPFALYERTKTLIAAPPDVLRVDEKNKPENAVMNVVGVIFTTNHMVGGLYLPAEDRRHFVMWSGTTKATMEPFCRELWAWYKTGGLENVATYLRTCDISDFDPKASPPQTEAWRTMVASSGNTDADDMADALDVLGRPALVGVPQLLKVMPEGTEARSFLLNPGNRGKIPHRFSDCGYVKFPNSASKSGKWSIGGAKLVLYRRHDAQPPEIDAAVRAMTGA